MSQPDVECVRPLGHHLMKCDGGEAEWKEAEILTDCCETSYFFKVKKRKDQLKTSDPF